MELAEEESLRLQPTQEGVTVREYILDGLAAELELERELGVRRVEFDRDVLSAVVAGSVGAPPSPPSVGVPVRPAREDRRVESVAIQRTAGETADEYDFVFLHDRALSPGGAEMMAKIILAMGRTAETAPVIFAGELPKAKVYVVLGSEALKKWFPALRGSAGQWLTASDGKVIMVSRSPEYVLMMGTVSPAVRKVKMEMWTGFKKVMQRIR